MLINYSSTIISEKASNQINLFGDTKAISKHIELPSNISDWPLDERLNYECDSLGFFLSGHPLETCREFLERHNVYEASSLNERLKDGYSVVSLAGITLSTKTRVSPRGRFMSVQFSDPTAIFEVSIFDDAILANSRELLSGRTPLLINAEARKDEGGIRLTAQSIMKLDEFLKSKNSLLCLWIDSTEVIAKLKTYQHQSGNTKIKVFVLTDKKHEIEIDIEGLFSISSSNIAQIRTLPGILKLKHI
jgi:DNA polymerase-3 subunit alpha